jgi:hypothetical protein
VAACALGPDDPKLGRLIDEAVYVAGLPRAALDLLGLRDRHELADRIEAGARGELVARRDIDGIGKRIDVGKYLLSARVGEGTSVLARAGLVGELIPIELRLRITPDGTAKPSEALHALLSCTELPVRFVRAALICTQGGGRATPLELACLRAAFARSAAPAIKTEPASATP